MEWLLVRSPCQRLVVRMAIELGIRLSSKTAPKRWSMSRSSPEPVDAGAGRPMRRGNCRGELCAWRKCVGVCGDVAQLLFVWRRQTTQAKVAERRAGEVPLSSVPIAITCHSGKLPLLGAAAIEILVGRIRISVRGRSTDRPCAWWRRHSGRFADDRLRPAVSI